MYFIAIFLMCQASPLGLSFNSLLMEWFWSIVGISYLWNFTVELYGRVKLLPYIFNRSNAFRQTFVHVIYISFNLEEFVQKCHLCQSSLPSKHQNARNPIRVAVLARQPAWKRQLVVASQWECPEDHRPSTMALVRFGRWITVAYWISILKLVWSTRLR